MYVVTFYSYQGGAGRTTALVNVAADLVMRGRKVLLVDFDLAKPALSGFGPLRSDASHPGVVEFIAEYLHLNQPPALEEYVYQATIEEGTDRHVWVMPAGRRDDNYWEALARLDWQDLYAVREGFLFLEDLKAQWREKLQVDYVLIDAASGITDTTGVCTRQLPDDVLFLVVPDQDDLGGVERVMKEVFVESVAEGPRRIDIHLVTSKVPDLNGEEASGRFSLLEPENIDVMFELTAELPYDPALIQGRQVVMCRRPGSRLAQQYRQVANAIILGNCTQDREGAKAFLKELQLHPAWAVGEVSQGDTEEQWRWFDRTQRIEEIIKHFTAKCDENGSLLVDSVTARRNAEVLGQAASNLFLADNRVRAAEVLNVALDQSPDDPALLWQRASYRFKGGDRGFVEDLMNILGQPANQAPALPPADQTPASPLPRKPEEIRRLLQPRLMGLLAKSRLPGLDTQPLRHDVLPLETVSGIESYVVSAVRLLHKQAPERLEDALQRSRILNLSQADRDRLLLKEMPEPMYPDQGPEWLIRWKHFREVINRLGPAVQGASVPEVSDAFHLAMAYWAVGEEAEATRISQEALNSYLPFEWLQQQLDILGTTAEDIVLLQFLALLAFRADNLEIAKTLVFHLLGDLGEQFQGIKLFSFWRYRYVRFSKFRDDCRDLQQMIQQRIANVPISLPPFLSKSSSGM